VVAPDAKTLPAFGVGELIVRGFGGAVALPALCVKRFAFSGSRRLRLRVDSAL